MVVFCDTSAFYAIGNRNDEAHAEAARAWTVLVADSRHRLVTTNYVVVETFSLFHKRQGIGAARTLRDAMLDAVEVEFVDAKLHEAAMDDCLRQGRRKLSLVDCASFAFMRRHSIRAALAFDEHFPRQGFEVFVPDK